jgi:antitoxin CptB
VAAPQPELDPARLRWHCRRGLRELDVLLERFLQERWPAATAEERAGFAALLELPDPELAALCLGRVAPPSGLAARLIRDITHAPGTELSAPGPVYPDDPAGGRLPGTGL